MIRQKGQEPIREAVQRLDQKLWHQLEEVWRKAAEGIHEAQRSRDGHQQGTKHCLAVEENLSALIPDEWKGTKLKALDLFVLSAAAALHDVGKAGDTLDDHGHVSMREVRTRAQDFGLDQGQAEVVGWIVQAHNDGNLEALPPTPRFLGTAEVDVRTLAALFKLADMLHTEYTRVSRQVIDFGGARGEDNPKTLFRLRVRGWGYDPQGRILLQAVPKDTSDIEVIFTGFEMMRRDLEPIAPVLQDAGFPYEFALPALDETDLRLAAEAERQVERAFVGMDFFREADAPRFKGRKADAERLYGLILSAPVALLVGDSGVGKSSLIHAGLFPLLRKTGWHFASTRPFADPTANVVRDVGEQLLDRAKPEGIVAALEQVASHYKPGNVLIVLDQFEDVTRVPGPEMLDDLRRALVAVQASRFRNIHLLLAYRSDAEAGVGPLFQAVTGSAQGLPRHYLLPLTREGARAALEAGFAEAQVGLEPKGGPNGRPILDVILDDIEAQRRGFYPPYLQMVGETLCLAAQETADKIVTAALYSEKGTVTKIIGEYLFSRLAEFGEREEKAKRVLVALVRSTGVRGQRSFTELQAEIKLDAQSLSQLLHDLADKRMIRHLGGGQYEMIHDYLAQLVDQKVVSGEERELKGLRDLLAAKAAAYDRTHAPLYPSEMAKLYLYREQIVPNEAETRLLLFSCLSGQGPAWYWWRDAAVTQIVPLLREALSQPIADLRQASAEALVHTLQEMGREAIHDLRQTLGEDEAMKRAAAIALARIAGRQDISDLRQMMNDEDVFVQRVAAEALAHVAGREEIPDLRQMLKDEAWAVRRAAAEALARVAGQEEIPDLRQMLKDEAWAVRRAAAEALPRVLQEMGREDTTDLRQMLKDEDKDVRWAAAEALACVAGREEIPDLRQMLNDKLWAVRRAAAEVLARVAGREEIPDLQQMVKDEDWHVRKAAAETLARVAGREAIPDLRQMLKDKHWDVRRTAAETLARVAGREAIPDLRQMLKHEDWIAREAATKALAGVAGWEAIPDLQQMLKDKHQAVQEAAAEALARVLQEMGREAIPDLRQMLKDKHRAVRRAVVQALAGVAGREAIPDLRQMLKDRSWTVRRAVVEALAGVAGREAIPDLQQMLKDKKRNVREAAAEALARVAEREAIPDLQQMLKDEVWAVRRVAAEALARVAGREDIPELQQMLKDKDSDVREVATKALATLCLAEDLSSLAEIVVADPVGDVGENASKLLNALDRKLYCPFERRKEEE
jgi:HEAT repeat protein